MNISSVQSGFMLSGSVSPAISSTFAIASPELSPVCRFPVIAAAVYRLYRVTLLGPLISRMSTSVPSGTISPAIVPHLEQIDRFHSVAKIAVGLQRHLPMPAELVEAVDVQRAQKDFERLIHVVQRNAERRRLEPIDIHETAAAPSSEIASSRRPTPAPSVAASAPDRPFAFAAPPAQDRRGLRSSP